MIRRRASATERAARIAVKAATFLLAVACAFFARAAAASELAILRNGFSIRHEHRLVMGTNTRLFLAADDSSFTDVPTAEIIGYEKDLSLPLPTPTPSPLPADSHASIPIPAPTESAKSRSAQSGAALPLNQVVNSASAVYHLDP